MLPALQAALDSVSSMTVVFMVTAVPFGSATALVVHWNVCPPRSGELVRTAGAFSVATTFPSTLAVTVNVQSTVFAVDNAVPFAER